MKRIPVCLFEDREDCSLGVRLLILSARVHEPDWMFHVFIRNFKPDDMSWLAAQPNVTLQSEKNTDQKGWNVKPSLIKHLLAELGGTVIWCDSDVILASRVSPILEPLDNSIFVATEEHCWGRTKGSHIRTSGWNMEESRRLTRTVNSCFMRIDFSHMPLLDAWLRCLSDPGYLAAQLQPWDKRPVYFIGDQDALTALLASSEYEHIPLYLLKSGEHIAQCFEEDGYTVQDRLINSIRRRVPPLIHAQGGKPWWKGKRSLSQQLSPYSSIALPYLKDASLDSEWVSPQDYSANALDMITLREPNLRGILPAFARTFQRLWRHRPRIFGF